MTVRKSLLKGFFKACISLSVMFLAYGGTAARAQASVSPEWADTMESYRKFLEKDTISWTGSEGHRIPVSDKMQFMTADLNSDGIPELLVRNTTYIYGWIEIYTQGDFGGVKEVVSCGELGGYYPGTPVFTTLTGTGEAHPDVFDNYYCLRDITKDIIGWQLSIGQIDNQNDVPVYYWNGEYSDDSAEQWYDNQANPVSGEEFESNLKTLTGESQFVPLNPEEWKENTEKNRKEYLQ